MTLIKSISGIRGTIGGAPNQGMTPFDVLRFVSVYAAWLGANVGGRLKVGVGRDARISGPMVEQLVVSTLVGMGVDVVKIGLATTPTTEIAVTGEGASGGIIITASHNPAQWNALKLLNARGEFLSAEDGRQMLEMSESNNFSYATIDELGRVEEKDYTDIHINNVLSLSLVDVAAIAAANFTVAIDCVNSVGGVVLPKLLKALGVQRVIEINTDASGRFAHNPEPLPENLSEISETVAKSGANVGFVVDPDVDRLAIVSEDGSMFGEEYTIVSVADYVLRHTPGNTVSNLSSSRALRDVTEKYGAKYQAAAVGEVNVVEKMKATGAVIGGEGNGGVIYPESHYGRDALVGIALYLTHLAKSQTTCTAMRAALPEYCISKNRIDLSAGVDVDGILDAIKKRYEREQITDIDGVKIDFADKWVHLRKSNTEPIIRIYAEAHTRAEADALAQEIIALANSLQ